MANGKKILKDKDKKVKVKTIRQLTKELDTVYSIHIRKRDKGVCFTCGVQKEWKLQQCGHYESRQHLAIRWNEWNTHCQCVACNVFKHGNMPVYALRLREKYGKDILERLDKMKRETTKLKVDEMLQQIDFYKQLVQNYDSKTPF